MIGRQRRIQMRGQSVHGIEIIDQLPEGNLDAKLLLQSLAGLSQEEGIETELEERHGVAGELQPRKVLNAFTHPGSEAGPACGRGGSSHPGGRTVTHRKLNRRHGRKAGNRPRRRGSTGGHG